MTIIDRLNKLDKNEIIDIVKNLIEHESDNLTFVEAFMDRNKILNAKTVTEKNVKTYALTLNLDKFIEDKLFIKEKNPKLLYALTVHFISETIDQLIEAKENHCYDGYVEEDSIYEELQQLDALMSTLLTESNIKSIKDLPPKDKFRILLKEHDGIGYFEGDDFLEECKSILYPDLYDKTD